MQLLFIDPAKREVLQLETELGPDVLAGLNRIDLTEADMLLVDPHGVNLEQEHYFRFKLGPWHTIGGGAFVVGFDPNSGELTDVNASRDEVLADIEWLHLRFRGVEEVKLGWHETPKGWGYAYAVVPIFEPISDALSDAEPVPEPSGVPAVRVWTVYKLEQGYKAVLIEVAGDGSGGKFLAELENENLDDLRDMLPPEAQLIERRPNDDERIVESWVMP